MDDAPASACSRTRLQEGQWEWRRARTTTISGPVILLLHPLACRGMRRLIQFLHPRRTRPPTRAREPDEPVIPSPRRRQCCIFHLTFSICACHSVSGMAPPPQPAPKNGPWCGDAGPWATPERKGGPPGGVVLIQSFGKETHKRRDTETQRSGRVARMRSLYKFRDSHREAVKLRRRETLFTCVRVCVCVRVRVCIRV